MEQNHLTIKQLEQMYMNDYVKIFNQAPFPLTKQEILKFHYEDVTHQFENLKKWKNEMDEIVKTWEKELQDELDAKKIEEGKMYGVFKIEDGEDEYDCIGIADSILVAKKMIDEDDSLYSRNCDTVKIFIGKRGNQNYSNNYKYIIESMEINNRQEF